MALHFWIPLIPTETLPSGGSGETGETDGEGGPGGGEMSGYPWIIMVLPPTIMTLCSQSNSETTQSVTWSDADKSS